MKRERRAMYKLKDIYKLLIFLLVVYVVGFAYFSYTKDPKNVPDVFHYVIFSNKNLDFITFLSLTSVAKVHKPSAVVIHTNHSSRICQGKYWNMIAGLYEVKRIPLVVEQFPMPTHVYGQRLSSVYHASDIARLFILLEYGGVYLDNDCILIKKLYPFFQAETTIALQEKNVIGNQVIIAKKRSRFLQLWLEGYKTYKANAWYFNAGEYPAKLIEMYPNLVHLLTTELGVQNLLSELYVSDDWDGWKSLYAIHLLSRHPPAPLDIDENVNYNRTFGTIARWLLYEKKPTLCTKKPDLYSVNTFDWCH